MNLKDAKTLLTMTKITSKKYLSIYYKLLIRDKRIQNNKKKVIYYINNIFIIVFRQHTKVSSKSG